VSAGPHGRGRHALDPTAECVSNKTFQHQGIRMIRHLLACACLFTAATATASTATVNFSVTNANDSGPGSLRQALLDLQANPDAALFVNFQPSYPQDASIQLLSPLPLLTSRQVTIDGRARNPRLLAPAGSITGILRADAPLEGLTLMNLRFEGGRSSEGGGCVHGMHDNVFEAPAGLVVSNSSFTDCQVNASSAQPVAGGAIHWRSSTGEVTVYSSHFSNNAVRNGTTGAADGWGGALSAGGRRLTIENSRFFNNRVEMISGSGGAIDAGLNVESTVIWDSVFANNRALAESGSASGGAVNIDCFVDCSVNLQRNYFEENHSGAGGALQIRRGTNGDNIALELTNNTFRANHASARGGALSIGRADLDLGFNTFEASSAGTGGAHLMLSTSRIREVSHNAFGEATGQHCLFFSPDTTQRQSEHNAIVDPNCRQLLQPDGTALTSTGPYALDLSAPMPVIAYAVQGPLVDAGGDCLALDARGALRPQDGNGDGLARCDIGAYERPAPPSAQVFSDGFEN
jgi:hypothetical protein